MVTLRELVYDIYNTIHAGKTNDSELVSYKNVEHWVIQARNTLIKQHLSKGNNKSEALIQHLFAQHVSPVDISDATVLGLNTGCYITRTDKQIPTYVDTDYEDLCLSIQPSQINSQNYTLITRNRISYLGKNKWNKNMPYAFIRNRYIYIVNNPDVEYITIEGIFSDPRELAGYTNEISGEILYNDESRFPISENMTEIIKAMILKNNGIILQVGTDISEDGTPNNAIPKQKPPIG